MQVVSAGKIGRWLAVIAVAISMLLSSLPASAAPPPEPERVHPSIARIANDAPNQTVRVIVQGFRPDLDLGAEIDRQGGKNRKSLALVKGYSADMPAARARELAKNPDVKWVSIDAPMVSTATVDGQGIATANLGTDYPLTVQADKVWNGSGQVTGAGVTVALLDSGINGFQASSAKPGSAGEPGAGLKASVSFNTRVSTTDRDGYGHGTHVAGIIAGDGKDSKGKYIGIAPGASLLNVKVSDDKGVAFISEVIAGLEWVVKNRSAYNIRVVNLSLVSSMPESYLTSPLDAAVESAWLSGIVVVVSAGNLGANSMLYPPANDPFVITVGAVDTSGTAGIADDTVPSWSSYGTTPDGFSKPDVVAPGRRIVSNLASPNAVLARQYPDRIVDQRYLRLSGTSMAAPVVSGIAALALQAHPEWTPDQVKSAIVGTARPLASEGAGKGEVSALGAVSTTSPGYANAGIPLNKAIAGLVGTSTFNSASWNSASWNSASWNSASWNSASWNSASWNSASWNSASWNSASWNSASWNSASWNSASWNSASWNTVAFPD